MSPRSRYLAVSLSCLAVLNSHPRGAEYVGPATAGPDAAETASGTEGLRAIPRNAYEDRPAVGVPVGNIFRSVRAPYYDNLRDVSLSPTARFTESVGVTSDIDLPDFRGSFPLLHRGFAPEDADLKIGPIYFKLRHISAAVLYSDNVEHSNDDRQSDVLGIMSIGGTILAQLSEGFQIAASGNFVYLPFEGESGFSGFSLRAPYSFGVAAAPFAQTQVVWQPVFFGLPFTIADEFRIGLAQFRNGAYDGFALFEGSEFDSYDRSGIYTLRGRSFPTGDEFRETEVQDDTEFLYYSNEVSVGTGGPLPGQNIFRFRASHENIWYQDERADLNFPTVRDRVVASIESVRENLRFKPYARYEYFHRDNPQVNDHELNVGAKGPITDLLYFKGEVGVLLRTEQDTQDLLWRAGLYHNPSPYTWQSLEYSRQISDFHDELDQQLSYRISKTLGPELTATAYSSYGQVEDLFDGSQDRTEWRNGLRLSYTASPRDTFRLTGQHARIDYDDGFEQTESWRGRFEWTHRFYDRFVTRAIYQYQQRDSDRPSRDYYENLVYLSLSWVFN